MKTKSTVLTEEERGILILAGTCPHGKFLSNREIGQHLGISANRVNTLIHQALVKLGARNRNEAILLALKRGDINIAEFWSPDELTDLFSSLSPDMLRKIANIVRQGLEHERLLWKNNHTIIMDGRQDGILTNRKESHSIRMKKSTILTKEERDILRLSIQSQNGKHLSYTEIGQHLGMPASKVKTLVHRVCLKLGAHSREKAINLALTWGEMVLTDLWSPDELAEIFSSLGPDMFRRIANMVRQGQMGSPIPRKGKQAIIIGRRQDGILTDRERDVIRLSGFGLTNKEIADRLYITEGSVGVFLNRAYTKLGVHKRTDVLISALKQREIGIDDIYPLNKIVKFLVPLGAESIEKIAQLMDQKLGQEPTLTSN